MSRQATMRMITSTTRYIIVAIFRAIWQNNHTRLYTCTCMYAYMHVRVHVYTCMYALLGCLP